MEAWGKFLQVLDLADGVNVKTLPLLGRLDFELLDCNYLRRVGAKVALVDNGVGFPHQASCL